MARCSECDGEIGVPADSVDGEIVTCPECGASFEVSAGGSSLKPAQTVGEDWGQ